MKKTKLIINPASGNGNGRRTVPDIEEKLKLNNISYSMEITNAPGHAVELAISAVHEGIDRIIIAGGDGTVNEVINGIMLSGAPAESRPEIAVLCVGRGNDFSYGVGIPTNWLEGLQVLISGKQKRIDLAYLKGGNYPDGRYVGNGVGIGFDAVVGFVAARNKVLTGFASYIWAALKTIYLYYKAPKLSIALDNEIIEFPALMVSIMNGRRMGGGFHMAPDSNPDDGVFDLCIVNEIPKNRMIPLMLLFMKGTQGGHDAVQFKRSTSVKVTALHGTIPAHADGETICTEGSEIDVQIVPGAIKVLVP